VIILRRERQHERLRPTSRHVEAQRRVGMLQLVIAVVEGPAGDDAVRGEQDLPRVAVVQAQDYGAATDIDADRSQAVTARVERLLAIAKQELANPVRDSRRDARLDTAAAAAMSELETSLDSSQYLQHAKCIVAGVGGTLPRALNERLETLRVALVCHDR
jgi:hypothetical protein